MRRSRDRGVVIVGSPGSGSSILAEELRSTGRLDSYFTPTRYVTATRVEDGNYSFDIPVSPAEFRWMVKNGEIGSHWKHETKDRRVTNYGFYRYIDRSKDDHYNIPGFAVYPANNSIFKATDRTTAKILGASLILHLVAIEDEREERLLSTTPDLTDKGMKGMQSACDDKYVYNKCRNLCLEYEQIDTSFMSDDEIAIIGGYVIDRTRYPEPWSYE